MRDVIWSLSVPYIPPKFTAFFQIAAVEKPRWVCCIQAADGTLGLVQILMSPGRRTTATAGLLLRQAYQGGMAR